MIRTIAERETLHETPNEASTAKVTPELTAHDEALIASSPFAIVATRGLDAKTIRFTDRRGKNRLDSPRNVMDPATFVDPATRPAPGDMLAALTGDRVGGKRYDEEWPERARKTLC